MRRDRSQALVCRGDRILLIKHRMFDREFYCLPGGGIDEGETPQQAAIRELKEEGGVEGEIERILSIQYKPENRGEVYTFLVKIDEKAIAIKGKDPELSENEQTIIDVAWLTLKEIGKVDRAYLWAAGLNRIEYFHDYLLNCDNNI